jgi:hypothetical protein
MPVTVSTATTLATFFGALLLFVVQPMVARDLLPRFGSTPMVWNTCMVFFQAALLAGYAYAHRGLSRLHVRRQTWVHAGLLCASLAALALWLDPPAPASGPPTWELLRLLVVAVGIPFLCLSATSPLLQRWFAETPHRHAADPYPLYAASNLGSLAALLGYPLAVEPILDLDQQHRIWAFGYGLWVAAMAICAVLIRRSTVASPSAPPTRRESIAWSRRLRWMIYAFVPSSMVLGATTHLTTDVAPIPLLWVLPLAVYLGSFVITFARRRRIDHDRTIRTLPMALIVVIPTLVFEVSTPLWLVVTVHLAALGWIGVVFHGELAETRPSKSALTQFYLWIALGGSLGSIFNTLVAPALFDTPLEYPLVLVLAALVLPRPRREAESVRTTLGISMTGGILAWLCLAHLESVDPLTDRRIGYGPFAVLALLFPLVFRRARASALVVAAILLVGTAWAGQALGRQHRARSFFASYRVIDDDDTGLRLLVQGHTIHGVQSRREQTRNVAMPYYTAESPIGELMRDLGARPMPGPVAILGLGTGALATYVRPNQEAVFFEIDPLIERIAREHFTFLHDCQGHCRVVIGDGRLELAREPEGRFEMIVVDAFLSGSIPTHLYGKEAIDLYLSRVAPGGLLVLNVTNRFLDLRPMLGTLAHDAGLVAMSREHRPRPDPTRHHFAVRSTWVVMARDREELARVPHISTWTALERSPDVRAWTDTYANTLAAYRGR